MHVTKLPNYLLRVCNCIH